MPQKMNHKIVLKDAFKQVTDDQDKIMPPDQTVQRFREKLKKNNLNILENTARIDNGRLDIPVFFSNCGPDALNVTGTKKQMGKGATPQQAEASAVMELAERFSFYSFYQNPENFHQTTQKKLGENALAFEQIAKSVHDTSEDLEAARKIFENISLKWAKGWNLSQNKEVMIPFDWFFAINEFNGACAGNCVEEALCQGICEVVERHVSSRISREKINIPAILTDSASDPVVNDMLKKYQNAGIQLYLSDFSLDIGIPTVGVLAWDPSTFPKTSEIVWTAGTTPDPQKALSRALSETAQLGGDFNTGSNYMASGLPKFQQIKDAEFITNPSRQISIHDLPNLSNNNIRIEIENLLSALSRKNVDVLAINTTHPSLQIPGFYTIIPGSHFRERATGSSVGMFCAKLVAENNPAPLVILELKQMDQLLPNKYYLQFYLGAAYLEINEPETALKYLECALTLDPTFQDAPSIYSYIGICLKEMGEYSKALDILKQAEIFDPDRTDIHNLMGFCHFKLKNHKRAIHHFKEVLRMDPGSAIDYANIASNYRDMGQKEKAAAYYEMALAIDPSIDFARENLAKLK